MEGPSLMKDVLLNTVAESSRMQQASCPWLMFSYGTLSSILAASPLCYHLRRHHLPSMSEVLSLSSEHEINIFPSVVNILFCSVISALSGPHKDPRSNNSWIWFGFGILSTVLSFP